MNDSDSQLSAFAGERRERERIERRQRHLWSIWYGGFRPRRRTPPRRAGDSKLEYVDWFSAHLLAVSLGILVLCATDAFLTLVLLHSGADEVNPVMALVVSNVSVFTAIKMALTGVSVVLMVALSRYRFLRLFKVEFVLYFILAGYATLIGYEVWLIDGHVGMVT